MDSFAVAGLSCERLLVEDHFFVPNSPAYYAVREIISRKAFDHVHESSWPTAQLQKANERGQLQLKPIEGDASPPATKRAELVNRIWESCSQLSDTDADVL